MADDDYPLNCIDDTGDGFSGWFAISDPRRCNDFCYWRLPSSGDDDGRGGGGYAAWNTADPHRSTVIRTPTGGTAYWTCVYDGADDQTTASMAKEETWIESWQKYNFLDDANADVGNDAPFPYLRCQKGAGERLKTWSGDVVRSAAFWKGWIVVASLLYLAEFLALFFLCKRGRLLYERVGGSESFREGDGSVVGDDDRDGHVSLSSLQISQVEDDGGESNLHASNGSENPHGDDGAQGSLFAMDSDHASPRCKHCAPPTSLVCKDPERRRRSFYVLQALLVVTLNLLLAFTISLSMISLMEINANPHFTEGMERLTPACTDPSLICAAGNEDIDRESARWPPAEKDARGGKDATELSAAEREANPPLDSKSVPSTDYDEMRPFSYVIASDAQLYWFSGEFAGMGREPVPPDCSPSDSCGRCTGKHGLNANARLKRSWESLMTGETDGLNASGVDLPIPGTLVMNGDLTAYFHPHEKHAYDSIYNNIKGLKSYWPSLGNHDIEHHSGAMFGGDEWVGMPNCNMEHAIGYFKSGFCGRIPAFDTDRIARYDSSSLAYSWDEGRYHFVHCHYYPAYEMASVNYRSSLEWLERDLRMARDAGLATVLFVHAVQGLNPAMENIILGKNVKAIIAGHTHRCLHRRCEGVYPLHEEQVKNLESLGIDAKPCIPAAYDTCEVLNGQNLIFVKDMEANVPFPKNKLHNREDKPDKPLCPQPKPFFINETDNSLLCRRVMYSKPDYPFDRGDNSTETIPIFWSGSSSFETFLRGDFFEDRIIINAMTVTSEEGEVGRYVDLHTVPNAIYPHDAADMEETVIYL